MQYTTMPEIDKLLQKAQEVLMFLKKTTVTERARLMHHIADAIEALGEELLLTAQQETNLPVARLATEKARTVFQWRSYADAVATGNVLAVRIDTALPNRMPAPKPDLRKTYLPVGIVTVFCASNFPFAYSTGGGDTASAIAAGCPVVVNAHSAHVQTSVIMAGAIAAGIEKAGFPASVFSHVISEGFENGQYLVQHPLVKAVGFTGSYMGGKTLYDLAQKRAEPIPVFAEMGSVNPVFVLPKKLKADPKKLAEQYAASLTLGVGQFCTNPGIIIVPDIPEFDLFLDTLATTVTETSPAMMLHKGIAGSYHKNKQATITQPGVSVLAEAANTNELAGNATVAITGKDNFVHNKTVAHEVFGPFGLVVKYHSTEDAIAIAQSLEGQLTATVWAETEEAGDNRELINLISEKCGRIIFNGFPTGVEVCYAMQHGGPFPAATDSRFTSVGPDAIQRFARPVSFQNWPDSLLPAELKNENSLQIWRTVNNELTKEHIVL
ncbi:aldehyde dehydrogenase (NADP(+)) [Terrimonas rubra]|uniref:Aldehyde dehydrogenase (NADP(+)) n=1 Tax=Terrimonas rubra TaxID=1035890 RepID=A0ABW6A370_9BACT